jgi:hypothetical protein
MKSLLIPIATARLCLLAGFLLLNACASLCESGACATESVERFASKEGFTTELLEGKGFQHHVSWRRSDNQQSDTAWVFIEGDGRPWLQDGTVISDDPSPRHALALQLAAQTRGTVLYLGRPCYFKARTDVRCSSTLWTVDRFSAHVVASMNEALYFAMQRLHVRRVVLVGHSGGGTLAALMATDLIGAQRAPAAVVTIAGNLDVNAWTSQHRYLPLVGSRNPANEAPLPASVQQFHIVGMKDTNVTPQMSARYLERAPLERVWRESRFDHDCCWLLDWPRLYRRILRETPSLDPRGTY